MECHWLPIEIASAANNVSAANHDRIVLYTVYALLPAQ